jgi:FRG domain
MEIHRIGCSWEGFRTELRKRDGSPLSPVYRGQAKASWALVSPSKRLHFERMKGHKRLAEKNPEFDVQAQYDRGMFDGEVKLFSRLATGIPGPDVTKLAFDDLEALARHNGLCSNLLDWSLSPYVAAFFAFTSALDAANSGRLSAGTLGGTPVCPVEHSVAVWRLGEQHGMWVEGEFECVTGLSAVNAWQKAQSGLFTRLRHKEIADLETYLDSRRLLSSLTVFEIHGHDALPALADPKDMNIKFSTLFPDFRGAAMQANFDPVLFTH